MASLASGTTVPGPCRVTRCTHPSPPSTSLHPSWRRKKRQPVASTHARQATYCRAQHCRRQSDSMLFPTQREPLSPPQPRTLPSPPPRLPSPVRRFPFQRSSRTYIWLETNSVVPHPISSLLTSFPPPPSLLFSSFFLLSIFTCRRPHLPPSSPPRCSFVEKATPSFPLLCQRRIITSLGPEEEEKKKRGRGGRTNLDPLFASHIHLFVGGASFWACFPQSRAGKKKSCCGVSWFPATDRQDRTGDQTVTL